MQGGWLGTEETMARVGRMPEGLSWKETSPTPGPSPPPRFAPENIPPCKQEEGEGDQSFASPLLTP